MSDYVFWKGERSGQRATSAATSTCHPIDGRRKRLAYTPDDTFAPADGRRKQIAHPRGNKRPVARRSAIKAGKRERERERRGEEQRCPTGFQLRFSVSMTNFI